MDLVSSAPAWLQSKFQTSQGCVERLCIKREKLNLEYDQNIYKWKCHNETHYYI